MECYCGTDCCAACSEKDCGGCLPTGGRPFGGQCVAAECARQGGAQALAAARTQLVAEFNALGIRGLHLDGLNLLHGAFVNLEYPLANGACVKLLQDEKIYWGNQVEIAGSERCYGVVADENMLLVCRYGCGGSDPEIILYKKRTIG